jgi:hypothetical protein
MKPEKKELTKGKMIQQAGYKKLAALLDESGKNRLIDIIKSGAVCELRERQHLSNGAQTVTVKIYFDADDV